MTGRRPRRPKMRRRVFYLDAEAAALLAAAARAHGVTQGEIVRSRIKGSRPGATPGSDAAAADAWWDNRKPARRAAIFRYHSTAPTTGDPNRDQLTIFEEGAAP